jgi:Chlamydia polymorphic membrane protein (Chlamydia_PMP) repeat
MLARAPRYAYFSLLVALICLAGCAGNGNPPPMMPSGTMHVQDHIRYIGPASRLAAPAGGFTFYVDGVHGNDKNDCRSPQRACKTIQHAVHITASGDTIDVAAALYPENVSIHHSVRINGAGQGNTVVDGERHGSEFLIAFNSHVDVTITGMTMRNGSGSGDGGAIYHCFGTLRLENVLIEGNRVRGAGLSGYGGAMYNCPNSAATIIDSTIRSNSAEVGGAICNGGVLTIIRSTFTDNTALEARGGGAIFNYGTLHVANGTFSGNSAAAGVGGAIHVGKLVGLIGGAQIDNSTISGNSAALGTSPGGGIYDRPGEPIDVQNTIIAHNDPQNCGGAALETEGFNLSSDKSCDLEGAGDVNGVDPKLGSLRNNGGPTSTMALRANSPAIDAGNRSGCRDWLGRLLATDQRGMPRPDSHEPRGCDIGAYESQ